MSTDPSAPLADPPTPEDGTCAHCGGDKLAAATVKSRTRDDHPLRSTAPNLHKGRGAIALAARADPFCSADCCRVFYGLLSEEKRIATLERRTATGKCKGCGVPVDKFTEGCRNCKARRYYRGWREAEREREAARKLASA